MRHKIVTKKKSFWYSPVITVVLLLIIGWGSVVAARATTKQRDVMELRNQTREELQTLRTKDKSLTEKIESLSTEEGIEEEIKSQYRVVKPHEQVVIIVEEDNPLKEKDKSEISTWERVRHFIGF